MFAQYLLQRTQPVTATKALSRARFPLRRISLVACSAGVLEELQHHQQGLETARERWHSTLYPESITMDRARYSTRAGTLGSPEHQTHAKRHFDIIRCTTHEKGTFYNLHKGRLEGTLQRTLELG